MNDSPSRILDLPLEESSGQADQHNGKSRQGKNIRIDARESGIFQEQHVGGIPKSATQMTQRIKENHREIRPSVSTLYSSSSPWGASVLSVAFLCVLCVNFRKARRCGKSGLWETFEFFRGLYRPCQRNP
jgi:hypothetical protein